jgi:TolA-binding protein
MLAVALGLAGPVRAQDPAPTPQQPPASEPTPQSPAPTSGPLPMPGPGQTLQDLPPPPWADARDVPNPAFLDTTDRRMGDDRPPPSPEQVAALLEMEAEVDRFTRTGSSYRDSVNSILLREYQRRRRDRQAGYARQIREEERLQNEARDRAIRLFEAFIRRYPTDPTYTPDAMFRLGELYYERSAIQYQDAADAGNAPASGHPDFSPTVELYRELIRRFPDYRRIDGVYYLIGYCLNEMGQLEEARLAWLNLVCANRFQYTGQPPPAESGDAPEGEGSSQHPALSLGTTPAAPVEGPFVDPYVGCTPVVPNARFVMEVWLRLGEYHFDYDFEPHALDRAISAYNKVLADPTDRNYSLALYKVAWAYYRASRYPEAIQHFGRLIDWSDQQLEQTGRAGSDLRREAVQYLGIAFAYDDWNENTVPDHLEGDQTGIQRIQDTRLLAQDRNWTSEIYFELGQVYFEETKYAEAIAVWELALQRWPQHFRAPQITANIARAYQRRQEMDRALAAQARLADYREGSAWWQANMDRPLEQRAAEQLAEGALVNEAIRHHRLAQEFRSEAVRTRNPDLLNRALEEYRLAADAYRAYLQAYPNSPDAYDLQYQLAEALFWSEQYEEAASNYAAVRDSNLDDRHLSQSARRVVESLQRLLQQAERRGEISIRDDPDSEVPQAEGTPPRVRPIEMPLLLQRVAQAREIYLARVPEAQDTERVRAPYDYNNALHLYFYGYWPQARDRFLRIYNERCSGPNANQTGQVAWLSLRNMAVAMNDTDEVERLGRDLQNRGCTFSADGPTFANEAEREAFCQRAENRDHPQCLSTGDLTNARYRRALDLYRQAEAASGDEQRRLYEQSATVMVEAVNDEPNHPDAPRALVQAGLALERTQRFDSAGRLYQRVIDEVSPRLARAQGEERTQLEGIIATAYFRLAYTANRFFDYDRAVQNYLQIADSPDFQRSQDPDMPGRITDSLVNAARILEYQQNYRRASEYYARAADRLSDPGEQRTARYRVAEMAFNIARASSAPRDWNAAIAAMQTFVSRYGNDRAATEQVVQAQWRIAEARLALAQQSQHRTALQDVVNAYDRLGGQPGSMAAEYAANSRFLIVDPSLQELEAFTVNPGRRANVPEFVAELNRQIQDGARRSQATAQGYEPILAYRRPVWSIAALTRQGRAYEILARSVLNATVTMPTDLQRNISRASPDVREEVRMQFDDQVRQVLDQQVRPIECYAVVRYALAARAAQAGNIDSEHSREAIDRLQAYGQERIAECIAEAQRNDATLQAYRNGEFTRARRGQHLEITPGVSAPPLAREDE